GRPRDIVCRLVTRRDANHNGQSASFRAPQLDSSPAPCILMSSCVLAYSGGLDTSVILGWLQDEGYEVHCAYVDLGQPCEDRDAILKKAKDCGAASARIVDA